MAAELAKLYIGSGAEWLSQTSGDDSPGNAGISGNDRQTTHYRYKVTSLGIARYEHSTDAAWFSNTVSFGNTSQMGGPLAAIFGWVHTLSYKPGNSIIQKQWLTSSCPGLNRMIVAQALASGDTSLSQWGAYQVCLMDGEYDDAPSTDLMQFIPPYDLLESAFKASMAISFPPFFTDTSIPYDENTDLKKSYFPQYYYEFSKNPKSDYASFLNSPGIRGGSFAIPEDDSGNPRLYLERVGGQIPAVGAAVYLGQENGNPRLECTIDAYGIDGEYYYVDVNSLWQGVTVTAGANPQNGGVVFSGGDNNGGTPHPCLCWIKTAATPENPWAITQGAAAVDAGGANGVEMLKSVLGASDVLTLAPSLSLTWVPEIGPTAGCDGYGWIDWDDLEDRLVTLTADERYFYRGNDQSFIDTLWDF